ncbi:MAG: damage-control phosphatase ARMT1 family protein [Sedimentisphaeraceae bacterium JB056]
MRTALDCIPCIIRQALDSLRQITGDARIQEEVLRDVLIFMSELPEQSTPPSIARDVHRLLRDKTGNTDPYSSIKKRSNDIAIKLYEGIKEHEDMPLDKFEAAIRLAIAGNIIDFGAKSNVTDEDIETTINTSLTAQIDSDGIRNLKEEVAKADSILYLADNAGEIIFDRFLIEQLPAHKTTLAVRGKPIINDATIEDAEIAGLTDIVTTIGNGSDAPGTILDDCSEEFNSYFEKADLIISKGQGNYETLNEVNRNIFFLLKVKCPMVAKDLKSEIGSLIIQKSPHSTL